MRSQPLSRANDRMLAALSAAMAMVRCERIVSSVDKYRPDLRTAAKDRDFSENKTTVNTKATIYIFGNRYLPVAATTRHWEKHLRIHVFCPMLNRHYVGRNKILSHAADRLDPDAKSTD
jgi:hypothetical protein